MALLLRAVYKSSPQRIRLAFTEPLASGAFSTTHYSLNSDDSAVAQPTIRSALAVISQADTVELATDHQFFPGALYSVVIAAGLPGTLSNLAEETTLQFRIDGMPESLTRQRNVIPDIYGVDLRWTRGDWAQDVNGDLGELSGPANAEQAIWRRELSSGIAWDPTYGARLRRYIDAPSTVVLPLATIDVQRQALMDPRCKAAEASRVGDNTVVLRATLFGGSTVEWSGNAG